MNVTAASLMHLPKTIIWALHAGITVMLLGAATLAHAEFTDYPHTGLQGLVSAQMEAPIDVCQQICTPNEGCAGFDQSTKTGLCRIFSKITGAASDAQSTAASRSPIANYAARTKPTAEARGDGYSFTRYRNMDVRSPAQQSVVSRSVEQCETACRSAGGWCKVYTYDAWNQKCHLKTEGGALSLNARAVSGVATVLPAPKRSNAPFSWRYYNNKAFPGDGFVALSASERDECKAACTRFEQCVGFSYSFADGNCALYDYPGEYASKSGVDTGLKQQ